MATFFKPSDITTKTCTVNNLTRGGSAFAVCENGDQVFITPKIVDLTGIEVGDLLTAYCIDNHRPENGGEAKFAVRWRAVRVNIAEKFVPAPVAAPTPAVALTMAPPPITTEEMADRVRAAFKRDRAWTTVQLAEEIGVERQRLSSWLHREHELGNIAAVRIYAAGDQDKPSFSFYGRSTTLLVDLIDEIELDD